MKLKTTFLLCIICCFCFYVKGQTPIELDANELVSDAAFKKLLFQDLNFLILGENAPAQGISTELKDGSSQLSLKGLIKSKKNWMITLDGNFSVDEGIYFFDEDNGSKQANFAVNLFFAGGYSRNFSSGNTPSVQRALINRHYLVKDTIYTSYEKFYKLHDLMKLVKLPTEKLLGNNKLLEIHLLDSIIIDNRSPYPIERNQSDFINLISEFKLEDKNSITYNTDFQIKNINAKGQNQKKDTIINEDIKLNTEIKTKKISVKINPRKLLKAYNKALKDVSALQETIKDLEIENAAGKWTKKQFVYGGISPYYQRENITTFAFREGVSFSNLFSDTIGDLYGVSFTGSFYMQSNKQLFFGRLLTKIGRGSNFSTFTKRTYVFNDVVNSNADESLLVNQEKVAYDNGSTVGYTYGFEISNTLELYYTCHNIGVFGQIGYENISFRGANSPENVKMFPFRVGGMLNLKTKDDTKNLVTLQIFIDRSDLSIDPTPNDPSSADDWRFGFKIGLPINLKKEL